MISPNIRHEDLEPWRHHCDLVQYSEAAGEIKEKIFKHILVSEVRMAAVNLKVKVHPVVLLQIADSYERRSQDNHRVIGTLVGNVDKQSVEVTNCFCIPHKEYEERVEADIVYAQDMYELNRKVAPHETLVGWFATGSEITSHSALIHDYYARETKDPIHLTLDTTLTSGRVTMKAYVFVPLGVPGATSGSMFTPVQVHTYFQNFCLFLANSKVINCLFQVELVASEPEIAGLDLLNKTKFSKVIVRLDT